MHCGLLQIFACLSMFSACLHLGEFVCWLWFSMPNMHVSWKNKDMYLSRMGMFIIDKTVLSNIRGREFRVLYSYQNDVFQKVWLSSIFMIYVFFLLLSLYMGYFTFQQYLSVSLFFKLGDCLLEYVLIVECWCDKLQDPVSDAMANTRVQSNVRNMMYNGRNSLLPPKCPFSSIPPSYADYIPTSTIAPKSLPKPRGGYQHQRTSSESFLVEEQPSWLDDLLTEPDSPVRRGHRRSSSDSFAYCDGNMNFVAQDDGRFQKMIPVPAWGSRELEIYRNIQQSSFYPGATHAKTKNGLSSPRDNAVLLNGVSLSNLKDAERNIYLSTERQNLVESCAQDMKGFERKDASQAKYVKSSILQLTFKFPCN